MARAIICANCGSKFRANRERCPRCRAIVARPNLAADAAWSRKLLVAAGVLVGLFVAVVGFLWTTRPVEPVVTPPVTSPANQTARPQAAGDAVAIGSAPVAGAAFLDPSGVATVAYRNGDFASALSQFQAAVERNPMDAESWSNLGQVLVKLGRAAEAIPNLEKATSLNPDRWAYRFNLARALGLLGRWDESIASYLHAQRLFPDDYVTTFNLALALHKTGNDAAAVGQYRRAVELQPEDASFRLALAMSYERLQQRAEAIAAYGEYLRLTAPGPDADKVRSRVALLTGGQFP